MSRMIAFLVPDYLAKDLERVAQKAHADYGLDAGLVAAHALRCGVQSVCGLGLLASITDGTLNRLRYEIYSDGGGKGAFPVRQARIAGHKRV